MYFLFEAKDLQPGPLLSAITAVCDTQPSSSMTPVPLPERDLLQAVAESLMLSLGLSMTHWTVQMFLAVLTSVTVAIQQQPLLPSLRPTDLSCQTPSETHTQTAGDEACGEKCRKKGERGSPCVELALEVKFICYETQGTPFPSDLKDAWFPYIHLSTVMTEELKAPRSCCGHRVTDSCTVRPDNFLVSPSYIVAGFSELQTRTKTRFCDGSTSLSGSALHVSWNERGETRKKRSLANLSYTYVCLNETMKGTAQ